MNSRIMLCSGRDIRKKTLSIEPVLNSRTHNRFIPKYYIFVSLMNRLTGEEDEPRSQSKQPTDQVIKI
jgi:hypothetical protein